jgi:hypothetical protein
MNSETKQDLPPAINAWIEAKVQEIGSSWGAFNAGIRTGCREMYHKSQEVLTESDWYIRNRNKLLGLRKKETVLLKEQLLAEKKRTAAFEDMLARREVHIADLKKERDELLAQIKEQADWIHSHM